MDVDFYAAGEGGGGGVVGVGAAPAGVPEVLGGEFCGDEEDGEG